MSAASDGKPAPRLTIPEAQIPAWIFRAQKFEGYHDGRRFLCSGQAAFAVEGEVPEATRAEPSPLRFAAAQAPAFPLAELGRPFLRFDGRVLANDPRRVEIPRDGLEGEDYAIPLGGVLYDLRYVATVHFLFPGCTWRGPNEPSFAAAFIGPDLVALVAALKLTDEETARARGLGVFHGS